MAKKLAAASTPELLVTSHVSHDATKHAMGERVGVCSTDTSALSRTDHCTHAHKHDRKRALTHLGLLNGGGHCDCDYKEGGGKRNRLRGAVCRGFDAVGLVVAIRQE